MVQIAYKTAGHSESQVKGSLPEDYVTEFIPADLLPSLDGWTVIEEQEFQTILADNPHKLDDFTLANIQAQQEAAAAAAQESGNAAILNPSLSDLMQQLNDMKTKQDQLQQLIMNKMNEEK